MECNKQEAVRAKITAERKLLEKDFNGAKKIALKAQQLFPDLENISQLLSVCEVHCAASIKINGLEDWYGILQIAPTADESSIKKKYRKLALSLHPDKNKFAGAEAAFKLIGEAHRTLSDRENRSNYDIRRKHIVKSVSNKPQSQQANQTNTTVQPGVPNAFHNYGQFNGAQAILTKCPYCNMTHQLLRALLNRTLCCQNCKKNFVAYEPSVRQPPGTVPGYVPKHPSPGAYQHYWFQPQSAFSSDNFTSNGFSAQYASKTMQDKHFGTNSFSTEAFSQNAFKATQGSQNAADSSTTGLNGNAACKQNGEPVNNIKREEQVKTVPTNQSEVKFEEAKFANAKKRQPAAKSSKNQKPTRKMKIQECSEEESSNTKSSDSDVIIQEAKTCAPNMDSACNENRRRSTRQKRNVTYVYHSDDDFASVHSPCHDSTKNDEFSDASEISKGGETNKGPKTNINSTGLPKETSGDHPEDNMEEELEVGSTGDTGPTEPGPSTLTYPDPEFHDFDNDRDASIFSCGQIWATYDDLDGMPRFYAKIISVNCSFKVRFTWLETSPETQAVEDWSDAGLPVACGNFRLGTTETTDNQALFSHLMTWQKGKKRNSYTVKPATGDVWALYKNWNKNWSSDQEDHTSFEYEAVEILSEDASAINIAMLYKVEEFVSVFTHELDAETISIPSNEILRFSHRIPSYKIPVSEAESLCRVYYELDPAALPSDSKDKFPSVTLDAQLEYALRQIQEKCFKPAAGHA